MARMGMSGGNDPDCRKPMDWSKEDGPVWQRVHSLIEFRLKHDETFGKGQIKLYVTEDGLIEVDRAGKEQIHAYFNTTKKNVKISCFSFTRGHFCVIISTKKKKNAYFS